MEFEPNHEDVAGYSPEIKLPDSMDSDTANIPKNDRPLDGPGAGQSTDPNIQDKIFSAFHASMANPPELNEESDTDGASDHWLPDGFDEHEAASENEPVAEVDSDNTNEAAPAVKRKVSPVLIGAAVVFLILVIGTIAITGFMYFMVKPYENYSYIMPNVYCAGVNLGGMTRSEAQQAIEVALKETNYIVSVHFPDGTYDFKPAQEGVTLNSADIAQQAYDYLRDDTTAYGLYKAHREAEQSEYHLSAETSLSYSKADIEATAQEIYDDLYIAPTASYVSVDNDNHTVSITLGTQGRCVDQQAIIDAVTNSFDTLDFTDLFFEYEAIDIDLEEVAELARQAEENLCIEVTQPVISANSSTHVIDVTIGLPGYQFTAEALESLAMEAVERGEYGSTVTLAMEKVEPDRADVTDAYYILAAEPTEPYYDDGYVYEGTPGYTLTTETALAYLDGAEYGQFIQIPMEEVLPNHTAEELLAVLFRDTLGSYSTAYANNENRTTNLRLACQAINGTVINAGETFSFNGVVGERTEAKGYKKATVYIGTDSVGEVGGGICQVASTIYNAALYADLEVTNRAPHTFIVSYTDGGLDATVYYGSQDFCFRNNTEYPVRVDASVSNGKVNISIVGTKTDDHYVRLSSTKLSTTAYTTIYEYSSSLPRGSRVERVSPYTGYSYEAYQYIYDGNGDLIETNYLGVSRYQKRDRVITIGTG